MSYCLRSASFVHGTDVLLSKDISLILQTYKMLTPDLVPGNNFTDIYRYNRGHLKHFLENSTDGRSLVGYGPWGRKESDTTEQLH